MAGSAWSSLPTSPPMAKYLAGHNTLIRRCLRHRLPLLCHSATRPEMMSSPGANATRLASPYSWGAGLSEIAGADAGPGHAGGPSGPLAGDKAAAVGQAGPPVAGLERSAGDIRHAVAVEVA